ncbi:MAG: hypothetical protein COB95_05570, partial [Nitrosopumilales archaeon]
MCHDLFPPRNASTYAAHGQSFSALRRGFGEVFDHLDLVEPEVGVATLFEQEVFVGAHFDDLALFEYDDLVRLAHGGEAVAMMSTVRSAMRLSKALWICRSVMVSTEAVASSRMTSGGFFKSTRA